MKEKIYRRFWSDLLKRAFRVKDEGTCVRLSAAEEVLRRVIDECCSEQEVVHYDFWDQPIKDE